MPPQDCDFNGWHRPGDRSLSYRRQPVIIAGTSVRQALGDSSRR